MTESLRIASVTTFYPPYNFGGDGIDVQRTARALARRGHHVTVIHDRDAWRSMTTDPEPPPDEDAAVEVIGLQSRAGRWSTLLTHQMGRPVVHARQLRELTASRRFDAVLFNNVSLVGGPGILQFGGNAVRIYIAHEHWLVCPMHVLWRHNREACPGRQWLRCSWTYRRPPQLWRHTGVLQRSLRHVDVFFARSEFSRRKHQEFGFPREMEVLPYVLPASDTPGGPVPHHRPYFLYAGRLERIKGVDELIDAFPRDGGADLLIAGEGTEGAALRQRGHDHPQVHFLGQLLPEALATYYRHALALLVPSRGFETFGLVVAEALNQGTPVIARRIGPLPELIDQVGGGSTFTTTDELVALLHRCIADPQRARQQGERARLALRKLWADDAAVERILATIVRERARKSGKAATH